MAEDTGKERHASDEELLADAIPIDSFDDEPEDADDAVVLDEEEDELAPIDLVEADPSDQSISKITMFGPKAVTHDEKWNRKPNVTGTGAIHVKTFVTKLRLDAIDHLDEQINEWLDKHPEYEVKFVTTSVGQLVGKVTEEALFVNVWV